MSKEELADVSSTSAPPESHPRASQDEVDTTPPFISEISEGTSPEVVRGSAHLSGTPLGTPEEQSASSDATGGTAHRREEVTKSKLPTPTEPSPNSRTESVHNSTDREDLGGSANHGAPEEQDGNLTAEENNGIPEDPSTFGGLGTGDVPNALNANEDEQSTSSIAAGGAARRIEPPPNSRTESVHTSTDTEDLGGSSNHRASKEQGENLPAEENKITEEPLIPGGLDPGDVPDTASANEAERSRLLADIFSKWEVKALARAQAMEKTVLGDGIGAISIEPKYTCAELRGTYKGVCEAAAGFELSASTLRTNSKALTLCKTLLEQSAPDIFHALRDFRPQPRPELPNDMMEEREQAMKGNWKHDQGEALNVALFYYSASPRERLKARAQKWEAERSEALRDATNNWEVKHASGKEVEEEVEVMAFGVSIAKLAKLAFALSVVIECDNSDSEPELVMRTLEGAKETLKEVLQLGEMVRELKSFFYYDQSTPVLDMFQEVANSSGKPNPTSLRGVLHYVLDLIRGVETAMATKTKNESDEVGKQLEVLVWNEAKNKARMGRFARKEFDREDVWSEDWGRARAQALQVGHAREPGTIDADGVWKHSLEINDNIHGVPLSENLWDGGRLRRARDALQWMEWTAEHRVQYGEEWQREQVWWKSVLEWEKRSKSRCDVIDALKTTCVDLMQELEKIDGSASARESNFSNASHATYEDDRCHLLVDYIYHAKVAMHLGDERQFVRCCNSVLDLVGQTLRSNEVKQGLKTLIKKQDHFRNSFMDFATVAIFFSSITATTLQFSYQSADGSTSSKIVNGCWFASLVLSIASATNSLLGVVVHQSPEYLRPSRNLDFRILQNWFRLIPPSLLAISGVLFSVGLCGFTFLSSKMPVFPSQGRAIQAVTSTLTSTNFLALLLIFFLTFTRVIHRIAVPVRTVYSDIVLPLSLVLTHLVIVLALLFLAFLALPFMPLFCLIWYKDLPPNFRRVLRTAKELLGKLGSVLGSTFNHHLDQLEGFKENKFLGWPVSFICFITHLVIVLALLFLALVATPYCLICYKDFPPDYEDVLSHWRRADFGTLGSILYILHHNHRGRVEGYIRGFRAKLKELGKKIGRLWKKIIEVLNWRAAAPSPPGS